VISCGGSRYNTTGGEGLFGKRMEMQRSSAYPDGDGLDIQTSDIGHHSSRKMALGGLATGGGGADGT